MKMASEKINRIISERSHIGKAIGLSLFGLVMFQFFGNSTRGYIDTPSVFVWWVWQWFDPASDLQHSPLVLLFVIGFAYQRWKKADLDSGSAELASMALLALVVGIFLNAFGFFVQQTRFNCVGVLAYAYGLSYFWGGSRLMRGLGFPLLFFFFTLPFQFLQEEIGYYLRAGVIQLSQVTVELIGIQLERSGTILSGVERPFIYDVAPACSGMRSLLILTAISFAVGGILFQSTWRRLVLLGVAIPLAVLGNWIRISSILIGGHYGGQSVGGIIHEWFGFLVFAVVLGGALGVASLLEKWAPEKQETAPSKTSRVLPDGVVLSSAVLMLLASIWFWSLNLQKDSETIPTGLVMDREQKHPAELPTIVDGDWTGQSLDISEAEKQILPEDTGFARKLYTNWEGDSLLFSILLSGQDRSSIHRPEICLAAQGYTIQAKRVDIIDVAGLELEVTVLEASSGQIEGNDGSEWKGLFIYWFVSANTQVASHQERMVRGILDRLAGKPSRWAYLLVQTPMENSDTALQRIERFLDQSLNEVLNEKLLK